MFCRTLFSGSLVFILVLQCCGVLDPAPVCWAHEHVPYAAGTGAQSLCEAALTLELEALPLVRAGQSGRLPERFLWIAVETTGHDQHHDQILEVALLVTDREMKPLASYQRVLFLSERQRASLPEAVVEKCVQNGLWHEVRGGAKSQVVETEILDFLSQHFAADQGIVTAGAPVSLGNRFLKFHFPKVGARFAPQALDVTALRLAVQATLGLQAEVAPAQRADQAVQQAVREFKAYQRLLSEPAQK